MWFSIICIIQFPMMKVVAQDIIDKPIIKVDKNAIGKDDERQYERQYQKAFERAKYLYHRGIYDKALQSFKELRSNRNYKKHWSELDEWVELIRREYERQEQELQKMKKKAQQERKAVQRKLAEEKLKKGLEEVDSLMDIFQCEKAKVVLDSLRVLPIHSNELQTKNKELLDLAQKKALADKRIRDMAQGLKRLNPEWMDDYSPVYTAVLVNGEWGYVDSLFQIVIPCQFDEARSFKDSKLAVVRRGKKFGVINRDGVLVIPCKHKYTPQISEGIVNIGKYYYGENGQKIAGPYYLSYPFSEGFAVVYKKEFGRGYFIDKNGEEQPNSYEFAYSFGDGVAEVSDYVNGKLTSSFIDKNFKKVLHVPNNMSAKIGGVFSNGVFPVYKTTGVKEYEYGYIDKTGRLVIPFKYKRAGNFKNGFAKVDVEVAENEKKTIKTLYVDTKGNEYPYNPNDKLIPYYESGKTGFKSRKGNVVKPATYDSFIYWSGGIGIVRRSGRLGLINEYGTSTFDFE